MLAIYLGAFIVAIGVVGVQLAFGHDADAGGGHDVHAGVHDGSPWLLFVSLRFWAFALLAFGLVGSILRIFNFAGDTLTLVIAIAAGFTSGFVAVTVIRNLLVRGPQSMASVADVAGKIGRVTVSLDGRGPGKVRVEVSGSYVDVTAYASEPIEVGDAVIVDDMKDGDALVSRAPKELKP